VKQVETLLRAYDDGEGVTAQFNLNLLARINRERGGDFRLDRLRHVARWNDAERAVEMHLLSLTEQWASIGQRRFHFREGETIHTESSRKYDREGSAALAERAGSVSTSRREGSLCQTSKPRLSAKRRAAADLDPARRRPDRSGAQHGPLPGHARPDHATRTAGISRSTRTRN
jgi:hypothetical protein